MNLRTTAVKITGTPDASGWTQVHEFVPDAEEKRLLRGHLYAVLATKRREEGVDEVSAGRELLFRLHEEYFGNLNGNAFEILKAAVAKVVKEFSENWGDVEIAAVTFMEGVIYAVAGGGGCVSLYRQGMLAEILNSATFDTISASGYPQDKDLIILGTKNLYAEIPLGVIKGALGGASLEEAVETLAPKIQASSVSGSLGMVLIKVEEDKPQFFSQIEQRTERNLEIKRKTSFLPKLSSTFKKILQNLEKILPERKIFVRRSAVNEEIKENKSNKVMATVGAILLILLVISIGFGLRQSQINKIRKSYQADFIEARKNLNEAESIFESDPAAARELFVASQNKINAILEKKIEDPEVTELKKQIDAAAGKLTGVREVAPELYLDLSLLSSGFSGSEMVFSGKKMYVLDRNGKKVVGVDLVTKKTSIVVGPEMLEGIKEFLAYDESVYGIFEDGIYKLGDKKEKVIDKSWEGEVLGRAYGGNIYLVAKETNNVWRFSGMDGVFGAKTNWLAAGTVIDFSKSKQIVIDGSLWILSETSKITRLSLGNPQAFAVSGVLPEVTQVKAIYTNEEQRNLYLLTENRVVVVDKTGKYQGQYQNDQIGEAIGLVVSEKDQKIILLTGAKLLQISITE